MGETKTLRTVKAYRQLTLFGILCGRLFTVQSVYLRKGGGWTSLDDWLGRLLGEPTVHGIKLPTPKTSPTARRKKALPTPPGTPTKAPTKAAESPALMFSAKASKTQIITPPRPPRRFCCFFHQGAKKCVLRCGLHPAPYVLGAGRKTRLGARIGILTF